MDAQLIFPPTGQPQGFSTLAMTQWDGKPEPIVRELLQNCLDAAREAGRDRAEVWFTISERPLQDLPGSESYGKAFQAAVGERSKDVQGRGERRVIESIDSVLGHDCFRVLHCRDNGRGFDNDSLKRVLTEGNTDKKTGGGTTGVGHLTAFAASDLRYVLYAGRSRGQRGELRDVVSGHASLASHRSLDDPDLGISGDGYLLRPGQRSLFATADYPDQVPELLAAQMKAIEDTGSVVCIAGFNSFLDQPAKVVESLRRVAAPHFLAALAQDKMVVHVRDENGEQSVVDRSALETLLGGNKEQRTRHGGVLLPGEQAYRAWRVFSDGDHVGESGLAGVSIRFRQLPESESSHSRIQVYRDGMWITNDAPFLLDRDFRNNPPFDAVVLLEPGELYDLVRDAEGPQHLGLDRERLVAAGNDQRWTRLRELLAVVRDRLRQEAGELESSSAFTPPDFATFTGAALHAGDVVPRYRPRQSAGKEGEGTTPKPHPEGDTHPRRNGKPNPKPTPNPKPRPTAPKPGRGMPLRSAVMPQRNQDGDFDTLRVRWRLIEHAPERVGVRVRVPSGSDETCDQPLGPEWLRLRAIEHPSGVVQAAGSGDTELAVPPADGILTITLVDPINDPNAVEVDIVRRKREDSGD